MNSNVMPSRVQMESALLQQLVAEVKETVATGVEMPASITPSFRAINLWNIQRRGRFAKIGTTRKRNTFLSVTHVAF